MCYAHFNKDMHYICLDFTRCKISTNIMPPHVKMSIKHDMGELFPNFRYVWVWWLWVCDCCLEEYTLFTHLMMSYGPYMRLINMRIIVISTQTQQPTPYKTALLKHNNPRLTRRHYSNTTTHALQLGTTQTQQLTPDEGSLLLCLSSAVL
jgi:hypothetical protein